MHGDRGSHSLTDVLSNPDLVLELEPEELGGYILTHLHGLPSGEREVILYEGPTRLLDLGRIDVDVRQPVFLAVAEAWQWLEREGLLVERRHSKGFSITRRGERLRSRVDVAAFVVSRALPRTLLHPKLVQRVWGAVLRGDYETAIFQAFREVEIAVREAAALPQTDLGVPLMRKAFDRVSGRLTRSTEPESEREALSHLFAGAIGRFKNPSSHRSVEFSLADAAEALMLASFLLRMVDERIPGNDAS